MSFWLQRAACRAWALRFAALGAVVVASGCGGSDSKPTSNQDLRAELSAKGAVIGSERLEPSECVLERVDYHVDGNYPLKQVVLPDGSTVITSDSPPENHASVWNACFAGPGLMPNEQQALFLSSQVFESGEGILVGPDSLPRYQRWLDDSGFEYVPPSVEFTDDGYVARYFLVELYLPQLYWVEQHVTDAEISTTYQSKPNQ